MSIPDLTPPWTRIPLVHETTDLFDPETQDALDLRYSAGGSIIPDASTTVKGVVELATTGETTTGTDTVRATTPAGVKAAVDQAGTATNPHTTEGAARNGNLTKNFWQYSGTAGVNDPDNWIAGDEWISV